MKQFWIVCGSVVGALGLSALIVAGGEWFGSQNNASSGAKPLVPWQIEVMPNGGSKVMGLTLGSAEQGASTLADVQTLWGKDNVTIAIVATPDETGNLEAYIDPVNAGVISGKAVVTASLPDATIVAMRERSPKTTYMNGTTRKATVALEDMATALQAPVAALSFIPSANLDEAIILARFGQPAERVRINEHAEHFLYPNLGLDLVLDAKGKELLQYVSPSDFERLREPLLKATASQAEAQNTAASAP